MFRKVIRLKKEGLKLTCGAGCPVGRGVVEIVVRGMDG